MESIESPLAKPQHHRRTFSLTSSKKSSKIGRYLPQKMLYFSNETKALEVAKKIPTAIPVFNIHDTLPHPIKRDHYDEIEVPDIDLYNFNEVSLAKYLPETSPLYK
jgi:hypothetical protein